MPLAFVSLSKHCLRAVADKGLAGVLVLVAGVLNVDVKVHGRNLCGTKGGVCVQRIAVALREGRLDDQPRTPGPDEELQPHKLRFGVPRVQYYRQIGSPRGVQHWPSVLSAFWHILCHCGTARA